jgi:hypothetical protein
MHAAWTVTLSLDYPSCTATTPGFHKDTGRNSPQKRVMRAALGRPPLRELFVSSQIILLLETTFEGERHMVTVSYTLTEANSQTSQTGTKYLSN